MLRWWNSQLCPLGTPVTCVRPVDLSAAPREANEGVFAMEKEEDEDGDGDEDSLGLQLALHALLCPSVAPENELHAITTIDSPKLA